MRLSIAGTILFFAAACAACGNEPARPPELGNVSPVVDAGVRGGDDSGLEDAGESVFGPPAPAPDDDPTTCDEAAAWQSYVGCDYWPTVVANVVWSVFDYAVVVANAGQVPANVTISGPEAVLQAQTIEPNGLAVFYLPWVPELKGSDADSCGEPTPLLSSVLVTGGAYHLVSSVPVTVYQFNALEYVGAGGPAGKSWAACPGSTPCENQESPNYLMDVGCYSFSNDASLLLPSTALTGAYRVEGFPGETVTVGGMSYDTIGSYFAITATKDGTHVVVNLSSTADVVAGNGVAATPAKGELDLTMNAGDVAQLVGTVGDQHDPSGTLVTADNPVQVIAGTPCQDVPEGQPACDHLEQSIFPAETLGQQYFVNTPTGPLGSSVGHIVQFYGEVDGTTLTFAPSPPSGCPSTIDAGQVASCGVVDANFEVTGSNPFGVATFMLGGTIVDPQGGLGDPSQSLVASVEQYRTKYVFLAPNDYVENFVDIVGPRGTSVYLDGQSIAWVDTASIADGYSLGRAKLSSTTGGAHVIASSAPIGVQVLGYGEYTSYQYPAGLNLKHIAPTPTASVQ